jgi:hypothetical protein
MSHDAQHETGTPSTPLEALRRVLARRPEVRDDPEALRNLLLDHCPAHRSEINWLVNAAAERVPQRIANAGDDTPRDVLIGAVRSTLAADLGMTADAAAWTAGTWYDALRGTDRGASASERPAASATPPSEAPAVPPSVLPAPPASTTAPEITMDMLRGAQDHMVGRAWRGLVIAIVACAAGVLLLLRVQFFRDDLFGRLESLRTGAFAAVITGSPAQPPGVWPLLVYALLAGIIITVIRARVEQLSIAEQRRRMWSPNPKDWAK